MGQSSIKKHRQLAELAEEISPFHNHIGILYDTDLVRILGVGEEDNDLYYVCSSIGRGVHLSSAVGFLYSLKGMIPEQRYAVRDAVFTVNGVPPTDAFDVRFTG